MRLLTLLDQSEHLIASTLWEEAALDFHINVKKGDIIVIKGAKISMNEYHGVSLNVSSGTFYSIDNMAIKECKELKNWYSKKNYKLKGDLWSNLQIVFEQEESVDIDHMLDRPLNNLEKYTKN